MSHIEKRFELEGHISFIGMQGNKARGQATVTKHRSWIKDAEQLDYSRLQEITDLLNQRGCKSPN